MFDMKYELYFSLSAYNITSNLSNYIFLSVDIQQMI